MVLIILEYGVPQCSVLTYFCTLLLSFLKYQTTLEFNVISMQVTKNLYIVFS